MSLFDRNADIDLHRYCLAGFLEIQTAWSVGGRVGKVLSLALRSTVRN
jgi:hypothetical protein